MATERGAAGTGDPLGTRQRPGIAAGAPPAPLRAGRALRAGEFDPGPWRRLTLSLANRRLDVTGAFAAALRREAETGSAFNLVPVALAAGILVYFAAPAEPVLWVVAVSALALAVLAWRMERHGPLHLALVGAALVLAGMAVAQLRTELAYGPAPAREATVTVTGLVLNTDANSGGRPRYLIRPEAIDGLDRGEWPVLVRLSSSSAKTKYRPGDRVTGRARLMPISGPAFPGGYDFGFFSRFDGIGATGFFYGAPKRAAAEAPAGLTDRVRIGINRLRGAVAERIRAGLPSEAGDVAVALITGDRSGIDDATAESLRRSGLAHVLAISGLHMALVAMTVIAALRWLVAWSPAVTLNHPIRKWAAGAGLAAASAYLAISGASVATQRAWIMIAVMLTAMLADRRAITIRNVAVAATVILVLSPESLLEPGFQMSFAAAAALVAAYHAWSNRRARQAARHEGSQRSAVGRLALAVPAYLGGIVFTSLVAGLATGLFAAWHFHRVAPLGLVANALAMPVVSLAVMPMALASALLMPYGLEGLTLGPLGLGIEAMIAISDRVNALSAGGITGIQPASMMFAGSVALVLLTGLRSRLRLIGLAPLAVLPFLLGGERMPDLLVSEDGQAIAVADGGGRLALLYPRRNRFVSEIWLRAWSGGMAGEIPAASVCNRDFCAATVGPGQRLEVVYDPDLLGLACESADILVAPRLRWVNCRGRRPLLVLKRGDLEARGSHAVWIEPAAPGGTGASPASPTLRIVTALVPGNRPWSRPPPPEPDPLPRRPSRDPD